MHAPAAAQVEDPRRSSIVSPAAAAAVTHGVREVSPRCDGCCAANWNHRATAALSSLPRPWTPGCLDRALHASQFPHGLLSLLLHTCLTRLRVGSCQSVAIRVGQGMRDSRPSTGHCYVTQSSLTQSNGKGTTSAPRLSHTSHPCPCPCATSKQATHLPVLLQGGGGADHGIKGAHCFGDD